MDRPAEDRPHGQEQHQEDHPVDVVLRQQPPEALDRQQHPVDEARRVGERAGRRGHRRGEDLICGIRDAAGRQRPVPLQAAREVPVLDGGQGVGQARKLILPERLEDRLPGDGLLVAAELQARPVDARLQLGDGPLEVLLDLALLIVLERLVVVDFLGRRVLEVGQDRFDAGDLAVQIGLGHAQQLFPVLLRIVGRWHSLGAGIGGELSQLLREGVAEVAVPLRQHVLVLKLRQAGPLAARVGKELERLDRAILVELGPGFVKRGRGRREVDRDLARGHVLTAPAPDGVHSRADEEDQHNRRQGQQKLAEVHGHPKRLEDLGETEHLGPVDPPDFLIVRHVRFLSRCRQAACGPKVDRSAQSPLALMHESSGL